MTKVNNHGNPSSKIWVIAEEPYAGDVDKGYIWSAGYGYTFRKVWGLAKLPDPYIYVMKPVIGATYDFDTQYSKLISELDAYQPPFILPTSVNLFSKFCSSLVSKSQGKALFKKYAGNLLTSSHVPYGHYIIPQYPPDFVSANYEYLEIQSYIDLGHVREELEWYTGNGALQPLPQRKLITEPTSVDLIAFLSGLIDEYKSGNIRFVSVDIETIRAKKGTLFHKIGHPGYPYTISLSSSPHVGISFSFWDYSDKDLVVIWRLLAWILANIPIIGQNFSVFDAHFLDALGMSPNLLTFQDTLIRHHILWPELPHTLQFQTKQYTREPFYKDEGKQWTPKYKKDLMRYNALDTTVTYEVYLGQELEFNDKPHLRG